MTVESRLEQTRPYGVRKQSFSSFRLLQGLNLLPQRIFCHMTDPSRCSPRLTSSGFELEGGQAGEGGGFEDVTGMLSD